MFMLENSCVFSLTVLAMPWAIEAANCLAYSLPHNTCIIFVMLLSVNGLLLLKLLLLLLLTTPSTSAIVMVSFIQTSVPSSRGNKVGKVLVTFCSDSFSDCTCCSRFGDRDRDSLSLLLVFDADSHSYTASKHLVQP